MYRIAVVAFLLIASPAWSGEPADLVKRFYDRELDLFDAKIIADHTGGGLQAFMEEWEDFTRENPDYPCIDFDPTIDAQDYDEAELARTLKLDEEADTGSAIVTATFGIFGETRSVIWQLQQLDGSWKVTDLSSPGGEWRFSDMVCEPD